VCISWDISLKMANNNNKRNRNRQQPQRNGGFLAPPRRMWVPKNSLGTVVARDRLTAAGDLAIGKDQKAYGVGLPIAPFWSPLAWDLKYKFARVTLIEISVFPLQSPTTGLTQLVSWMSDPSIKELKAATSMDSIVKAWGTAARKTPCSDKCIRTSFVPLSKAWLPNTPVTPDNNTSVTGLLSSCDLGVAAFGSIDGPATGSTVLARYHIAVTVEYKDPKNFADKLWNTDTGDHVDMVRSHEDLSVTDLNHPQFFPFIRTPSRLIGDIKLEDVVINMWMQGAIYKSYMNNGGWEPEDLNPYHSIVIPGYVEAVKGTAVVNGEDWMFPAVNYRYQDGGCETCHAASVIKSFSIDSIRDWGYNALYYPKIFSEGVDSSAAFMIQPHTRVSIYRRRDDKIKLLLSYETDATKDSEDISVEDGHFVEDDVFIIRTRIFIKPEENNKEVNKYKYWYSCINFQMWFVALHLSVAIDHF